MPLASYVRASRAITLSFVLLRSSAVFAFLFAWSATAATSQDGLWSDATSARVAQLGQRAAPPTNARTVILDLAGMRASLANAPALRASASGTPVYLPMPDGRFELFEAYATQIAEKAFVDQMPELRNYVIQGVKDRSASGRINFTSEGLYAIVLRPGQTSYVETFGRNTPDVYVAFDRKAYYRELGRYPFECGVDGSQVASPLHTRPRAVSRGLTAGLYGDQLKTYRIAIAATTEFTGDQGGAANALTSITNTVTAISAIYERELAVNFQLVANNAAIIYSGVDPYTNGDLGAMLGENQANLDAVIGTANYDIGHVFGFQGGGGGGLASLASVCSATRKAQGGSQGSTGVGQPFLVDLVAHEIGHQHDANHTFNGTTGSCNGNRTAATAWEPASGTTLMSYAGICGAENIQNGPDQYFHTGSLEQMNNWIRVDPTGSSCGTLSATGNTPPSSQALDGATFTIPINTPFTLSGTSNDINGDALTHTWEQFDTGTASPPSTDNGNRPIFRSRPGTASTARDLPRTTDVLADTTSFGESYPTTNRTMNFRMTVRDNRAGGAGVGWTTAQVTSTTAAGPFTVTSLNAGGGIPSGGATNITWNVANTNQAPVNCAQVDILLSTDGGQTFPTTLADNTANDGSATVTLPNIVSTSARVKVACSNNIFFDINNADFGIGATLTEFCGTPGLALPTFGDVNDTLNVGPMGNLLDVNVSVDATIGVFANAGTFTVSKGGINVTLLQGDASCNGDNIGAIFDDEAAAAPGSVCSGTPAINGPIQPVGMLSTYDGTDQSGTWNLNWNGNFSCGGGGCQGTLDRWCVITAVALGGGGNNPPVLDPIGPQAVAEGAMITIPLSAMDPDGDGIVLSQMNMPGFCNFTDNTNGTGNIMCSPMMGDANTYMITVTATDDGTPALQDDETFMLTVTGVASNNPPVLDPIGPQTVAEGAMLTIPLTAMDQDGNNIALSQTGMPGFCTFTDNTGGMGTIMCSPMLGDANTYNITVTATDDGTPPMNDFETFALTVTPAGGTINQCVQPNLAIPFNGTQPTVSDIVLAQGDLIDDLDVTLRAPHAYIGDLQVSLTHVNTGTSVLLIDQPGNPPLDFGCDQPDIDVVLDDEGGDGTAESACSTTPPAMGGRRTPNNPLSGFDNESAAGTWRLTITDTFTDADDGTLQEWCITIAPAVTVNNPPVLGAIGNQTVAEGATLDILLTATDQDMDTLSFSENGLPNFCNLTGTGPGTATISCSPMAGDANTYPVTVTVTDDGTPVQNDDETFDIVVTPAASSITACSTPGTAVSDAQIVTDDIVIADTRTISDVNVSLDLPHTWVGDLIVSLDKVGAGASATLLDQPGDPALGSFGCDADDIDAVFDDESATPAEDECSGTPPAIGGNVSPFTSLTTFDGGGANATWRLTVADTEGGDDGTLQEWCITIDLATGGVDSDGDGVTDDVDNCTNVANPDQRDSNGDGFGNRCDADLNNDCTTNAIDLGIFKSVFFTTNADADLDGNGVVNAIDLGIFKALFFMPPGPNSTGTCP